MTIFLDIKVKLKHFMFLFQYGWSNELMLTMPTPFVIVPINSTVIAHAGDGNFHTVILFDPNIEEHRREAERLNQFMVYTALSMDGMHSYSGMNLVYLFLIWTMK
jgi:FAD/FMN-containing dehydrogenase